MGNLAEWITGLAELAAVLTTLFFSFYQSYFDKKHKRGIAARSLKTMAGETMDSLSRQERSGQPLTDENKSGDKSYRVFSEWLQVKTLVDDPASEQTIEIANQIKIILDRTTTIDQATRDQVAELLDSLRYRIHCDIKT